MAINVSTISNYVDQNKMGLIRKSILGALTTKYFTLQTGVKGPTAVNLLNTTIEFGNGYECGWDEKGESTATQRQIKPAAFKVNMSFCDKTLAKTWMNHEVRMAAGQAVLPFEETFINDVLDGIAAKLDNFIWNGGNISGEDVQGILDIAETDGVARKQTKGATVYESTLAVYKGLPADSLKDSAIFMGIDAFRELVMELTAKNLYHYAPVQDDEFTIILPGTNIPVHGVPGLNGSNKIVGLNVKHTFYGTDMEGDNEVFDFWYSKDNQEFRLAVSFTAGQQVAFVDEMSWVDMGA